MSDIISVVRDDGRWTYFRGVQPVFQHADGDRRSFRMFTAQLICRGVCRQVDIVRAFGVARNSVIRSVATYRAGGVQAFYTPRATRGASVMTPEVTAQAQRLLGAGRGRTEVAEQLGLKRDTLRKAIEQGRLTEPSPLEPKESKQTLPNGEAVKLQLAERGTWIGPRKGGLWVRETRKLTTSGHQVSLISTAFGDSAQADSVRLFSRWSQENFLRHMMQHFAIDLLNEYGTEKVPGTKRPVVNPKWRELDRRKRSVKSKLTHRQARFAALTLQPESDESARARLAPSRKQLVDTVKMIAYRAETALASIVREELARPDDARSLLRDLFSSEADLAPDVEQGVLAVQIHPMSNPRSNRAIAHLLENLNAGEFTYPGTDLRLIYSIAGEAETSNLAPHQNPADQEV